MQPTEPGRQGGGEIRMAAAIGCHINGSQEAFTLRDGTGERLAGKELNPVLGVGGHGLVQGPADLDVASDDHSRSQGWEVLEVVWVVGGTMALGIIGRPTIVLGKRELAAQIDA